MNRKKLFTKKHSIFKSRISHLFFFRRNTSRVACWPSQWSSEIINIFKSLIFDYFQQHNIINIYVNILNISCSDIYFMFLVHRWKYRCYCCFYKNLHLSERIRKGESVLLLKREMKFDLQEKVSFKQGRTFLLFNSWSQ